MFYIRIIGVTLLFLSLSACSTSGDKQSRAIHQDQVIARWHFCLQKNIGALDTGSNSPDSIVKHSLIVCQGHKRDVLATFPLKFERNLAKQMDADAYKSGIQRISDERGVPNSISTSYSRLVANQKLE